MTELQARKLRRPRRDAARRRSPAGWRAGAPRISNAWYELRKSRTASIGAVMLVLLFGACIATPWIATHDPIKQNYRERLQPPSREAPSGHRPHGPRHLLAPAVGRPPAGDHRHPRGRASASAIGIPYGVLSGYFGGKVDTVAMRFVDGLLAFPGLAALSADRDPGPGMEDGGHLQRYGADLRPGLCLHAGGRAPVARLGAGREAEGIRRGLARRRRRQPRPSRCARSCPTSSRR